MAFLYTHHSDNLANRSLYAPTVTGSAEDPDYPATNFGIDDPAQPAKLTTTSGSWVWNLGSAKTVRFVTFVHHNLDVISVKWQGNSSDSWGAPPFSQAFTIPAKHENNFRSAPFLDLSGTSPSYQWWRLWIEGTNGAAIAIGEVWFSTNLRTLSPGIRWSHVEVEQSPVVEHRTMYGVKTVYDLNVQIRGLKAQTPATDSSLAALRSWRRDCRGPARPCIIVRDSTINEALMVRWSDEEFSLSRDYVDFYPIALEWEELSRGLYL